MKKKDEKYKFWARPFMAMIVLFGLLLFVVALATSLIVGVKYNGLVLVLLTSIPFTLFSFFTFYSGIRFYWLRIEIDSEKFIVRYLFGKKTLSECKTKEIKMILAKNINREGKFIVVKDNRLSKPNRIAEKNGYIVFAYSKKRVKIVNIFWNGEVAYL